METLPQPAPTNQANHRRSRVLLLFGLLWPLFTIGLELATRACAGLIFDPLPSWGYVLLTLGVPTVGWLAWRKSAGDVIVVQGWERFLLGWTWLVSSFYALCFLHLTWLAILGCVFSPLLFFTSPIFPLFPLATLGPAVSWLTLWKVRKYLSGAKKSPRWQPWAGAVAALGLLLVMELPLQISHWNAQRFTAGASPEKKAALTQQLRSWGSEKALRGMAYGNAGTLGSPGIWLMTNGVFPGSRNWSGGGSVNVDAVRDLYFRVYGRLFTDLPPLARRTSLGSGREEEAADTTEGFSWDGDRGGDRVGARLRGLSLRSSRMDWHLDEGSSMAYGEWTLEFFNQHSNAQEARCQMLLPPDGFVSRLTLWVNDEPREAAFAAKSKVKEAYRQVVVRDQRDPVMVNMVGPDRVLTQCFPVPPGGRMKIRLGITAPLAEGELHLPLFIERNFSIPADIRHALWVQSPTRFKTSAKTDVILEGQQPTWRQEVPDAEIPSLKFSADVSAMPQTIWTEDPYEKNDRPIVLARADSVLDPLASRVIFVVDTSAPLRPWAADLGKAIGTVAASLPVQILLATDEGYKEVTPASDTLSWSGDMFAGGRDNSSALAHAFDLARQQGEKTAVVWLHGPQPFEFSEVTALDQMLERSTSPSRLHALALVQGPNRLLEHLYRHAQVRTQGRCQDLTSLESALKTSLGQQPRATWTFTRQTMAPTEPEAVKVWDHLARLAVFREVLSGYQRGEDSSQLADLAARHQLVTAVSGAVVLETQQQYDRAGLKPVDPNSTPQIPKSVVPEPSSALLIVIGLGASLWRRRR